ncbi:MAG: CsgG/HfaB family protein, partial [Bacteroidaceae bacterium]|nr:CsgG/HfaB family protein [Bacteroidaceae bacterium]
MKKICMILATLICLSAFADNTKLRIAVFDPASSGTSIDEGTKVAIREIISSTIVNAGVYDIVERSLLEKVMQEQSFSHSGAVNDNDATEIGKLAGANKVV